MRANSVIPNYNGYGAGGPMVRGPPLDPGTVKCTNGPTAWNGPLASEGGTARPTSPAEPPGRFALWGTCRGTAGYAEGVASMRTTSPVVLSLLALGCVSEHGPLTNRMAQSGTRYLTRAARQPVSWQPWGREAFALAARLDRPVLLYVGADDCRWCAVMDREAYGDPVLGAMIDSMFVPVRVDRDERPDIAPRYQAARHSPSGRLA